MILATRSGKKGVVDPHGKVLVPFEFDDIGYLSDGVDAATARVDDSWGLIDLRGNWIIRRDSRTHASATTAC